jgi:hypothetical protein
MPQISEKGDKKMISNRKTAIIVGVLFIIATVSAILALVFYEPILNNPGFMIMGSSNENQVRLGALLDLILAGTAVGTSIMLFPFLKKHNESIALGYVTFRLFEAVMIVVGVISLLSLLTLHQEFVEAAVPNASSFQTSGPLLIAVYDWTFILGPHLMLGINTLMCSYLLYQTKLVPRFISVWGFVGAILIFTVALLEMFGLITSSWVVILAMPIATYEMVLAVRLIVKGFNLPAIASESARTKTNELIATHL